jgi:acyl-CoA dehydrogenase
MTIHYLGKHSGAEADAKLDLDADRPAAAIAQLKTRAREVSAIAAAHAVAVDAEGRFPIEAMTAAKAAGLIGAMVPSALCGEGAGVSDIAEICYILGGGCSSMAMIYAMHQVKAACIIRHSADSPWHQDFLRRVARDQLLLASSTTEGQGGGDVRASSAAVEREDDVITLTRAATVMSYGAQADAVVTTARRTSAAAASDQVLVVFEKADYTLTQTLEWETLGMRGTRSAGFAMKARGTAAQVMPEPYARIHAQTMTPAAHLFWAATWAGIAASAVERARLYTRKAARANDGQLPPGAAHFTKAAASLRQLRALIAASLSRFEMAADDAAALGAMDFQTAITLLKVDASELAVATVMSAMRACGLSGYRNDGDASIGRQLRDILSAPIMINNDRILANVGASALLTDTPNSLRDEQA